MSAATTPVPVGEVADAERRLADVYRGPWAPADALVWAGDPDARTASGAEPPGARVAELRRRVYREGATAADAAAYRSAEDRLERLRDEARRAIERAGIDGGAPPVGTADSTDPADPDEPDEPPARSRRLLTRRRVLVAAGAGAVAAGAAGLAVANRPPDLGPQVRGTVGWHPLPGAPSLGAATIAAPDLGSRSAAIAFLPVPATSAERIMAPRSPFFGRGSGSTDFDVHAFDVGVENVALTVACDADTDLSVELGVLSGVRTRIPQVALRVAGTVSRERCVFAVCPVTPFERPRILRVTTSPSAHYLVRAVFVGGVTSS